MRGSEYVRRSARIILVAAILGLGATSLAHAGTLAAGRAAYARGDYVGAARLLVPLAERGNAGAQALLGFMYANSQGVPQGYDAATYWYRLAAEQGDTTAQYLLGLMYDKGFGVPLNEIDAHMWLNLAVAHAPQRNREYYLRLRDAVASKMTSGQIAEAQWRAQEWAARPRF
jgi:TPR repeat protein